MINSIKCIHFLEGGLGLFSGLIFNGLFKIWGYDPITAKISIDIENSAEDERETTLEKMDTFDRIDHLERRALLDAQMNGEY